jgi:preprotein translocase subunit SecE
VPPGSRAWDAGCYREGWRIVEKIKQFLREVKVETKKVVYPNKDELITSTWIVIVCVMIVSVFLGIVDLSLTKLVGMALQ